MTIKKLSDNSETTIEGRFKDIFLESDNRSLVDPALNLLDKIEMNREFSEIKCFNEEFETIFVAERESDREMVQLFYSLNYRSKEFLKQQEEDKKQKESIKKMFEECAREYKPAIPFKEEKPKKKVPYYNKHRPF